ncbi:MAG TPA: ATP synthase F1 subunit delta [Alphaproteobacteria bacterium]|nr:ATP synthase F1 subunit delta [Alphaproteobacteria bacterium]
MGTPSPKDNLQAKKVKLYAEAFIKAVRVGGAFDETAIAMEELSDILFDNPKLKHLLQSKQHPQELKADVLKAIGKKANLGGRVEGLVDAMASNGDLALLPDVTKAVLKITREEIVIARVTTARPLEPAQEKNLQERLQDKFNKRVKMKIAEDPELLGGLKVQVGDTVIDSTLRGRLDRLRDQLINGKNNPPPKP